MAPCGSSASQGGPATLRGRAAALAVVAVVALSACGTAVPPGADAPAASRPAADPQPAVPTTDDASLVSVDPPQLSTVDMGTLVASPGPASAVAADGLQLDVISADCGLPGVRADGGSVRPRGQVCLLHVQVVGRGEAAAVFDPARTALVDAEGATTPPWQDALALPSLAGMATQVPPMAALTGVLVYDVPTGAQPVALVLDGTARAQLP